MHGRPQGAIEIYTLRDRCGMVQPAHLSKDTLNNVTLGHAVMPRVGLGLAAERSHFLDVGVGVSKGEP